MDAGYVVWWSRYNAALLGMDQAHMPKANLFHCSENIKHADCFELNPFITYYLGHASLTIREVDSSQ